MATTPLHPGRQERIIHETVTAAGVTEAAFSVESDTVLVTLFVSSVGGDLDVEVLTFTDTGREAELFSFPLISAPTTNLILKRAAVTMQRVMIRVTYTGAATYEVYARAIMAGLVDTRILGAANLRMSTAVIVAGPGQLLIPASLSDRSGIVIKNWSVVGNLYLGASPAEATIANGYPLGPKDALAVDLATGQALYATSDAPIDVRISEAGN